MAEFFANLAVVTSICSQLCHFQIYVLWFFLIFFHSISWIIWFWKQIITENFGSRLKNNMWEEKSVAEQIMNHDFFTIYLFSSINCYSQFELLASQHGVHMWHFEHKWKWVNNCLMHFPFDIPRGHKACKIKNKCIILLKDQK